MKFRRLERNNTMSDEPCVAKPRIDAEANHGIGDVERLLAEYLADENLQLGLREIKQHLEVIKADTHSS